MNEEIRKIAAKFLDGSHRRRDEHPAKALTPEERIRYADYLDSIRQPKGATSFREYREETESVKRSKNSKRKLDSVQLIDHKGELFATLEVEKYVRCVVGEDNRQFVKVNKGARKGKFLETTMKLVLDETDRKVYIWKR